MAEDRRRQFQERREIMNKMQKMPFQKWEKQKAKEFNEERTKEVTHEKAAKQKSKKEKHAEVYGLSLAPAIKPSHRTSTLKASRAPVKTSGISFDFGFGG